MGDLAQQVALQLFLREQQSQGVLSTTTKLAGQLEQ